MSNKSVFGILRTTSEAEALVTALQQAGFAASDVSMLFPDKGMSRDFAHAQGTKAPEGALIGSGAGGLTGGALGLLVGLGVIALPGLGALLAAGPLLAALGGAAVGAAAGSAIGALVSLGVPEIQAKIYEGRLREGNLLVAVHTTEASQVRAAQKVFEDHRVTDVSVTNEAAVPAPHKAAAAPTTRA